MRNPIYALATKSWRGAFAILAFVLVLIIGGVLYRAPWSTQGSVVVSYGSLELEGVTRSYRLAVPDPLPETSLPLLIALHGVGDSADSMADYSQLDRLVADARCYVVYPEGRNAMWSVIGMSPDNLAENRDILFVDQLLTRLKDQLPIDGVYLVGMSNGATFAQAVMLARSDIDAVVAHSGPKPVDLPLSNATTPILLIVGADDPAANAVRRDAAAYRAAGYQVEFIEASGLGHQWSTRHNNELDQFLTRQRLP